MFASQRLWADGRIERLQVVPELVVRCRLTADGIGRVSAAACWGASMDYAVLVGIESMQSWPWRLGAPIIRVMALGEDLLLLAIPRRGGRVRAADRIGFALRASVLVDLTLLGRITIAGRRIRVIDSAPTDDRRLDNALKALGGVEVPTLESWLRGTPRGYGMITMYLSRLADEGAVRFAMRRERIPTVPQADLLDYDRRAVVLARLDQVAHGRQDDDADRALGGLVHACGLDRELYRGPFGVRARRCLARLGDQREITASAEAARVAADAALTDAIAQAISDGLTRLTEELVKLMRYEYRLEHTTGWQHHDVTSGHHHGGYDSGGGGAHHHHTT